MAAIDLQRIALLIGKEEPLTHYVTYITDAVVALDRCPGIGAQQQGRASRKAGFSSLAMLADARWSSLGGSLRWISRIHNHVQLPARTVDPCDVA